MNVVVVCRPEDLATEFLAVLDSDRERPLRTVLAADGTVASLPPGDAAARLARVGPLVADTAPTIESIEHSRLTRLLEALPGAGATVWTHCPADERRDRAEVAWTTAHACAEVTVLHAVGVSSHYQFLSDVTVPLSVEQARLKLGFLHQYADRLAKDQHSTRHIPTEAVTACERFTRLTVYEADRLYALLHSMEYDSSLAEDPWDFRRSPYERERLGHTAAWVSRHLRPRTGVLIETGGCEGALTTRLLDAGHHVVACEPNDRFRTRLIDAVGGRARVTADSLEDLAHNDTLQAAAYLAIEVLYYVDDLSILDGLPSKLLFLAVNNEELDERVEPWLARSRTWEGAERVELVAPRVDFVCGERVYRRKQGSIGVLCRRRTAPSPSFNRDLEAQRSC